VSVLARFAPRQSRRRLLLKMARDFILRPSSIAGTLSPTNFHNARVSANLRIHCTVCGNEAGVSYDYPDVRLRHAHGIGVLRETLACRACGATMRDRQLAAGLLAVLHDRTGQLVRDVAAWRAKPFGDLRILDTDSFSAMNTILRGLPGYFHSQYKPVGRNGEHLPDGSLNVNLLDMPFPDFSFDVILTSDVMEHVEDDACAHREIFRCLARGGTYVFTIPFNPCLFATRRLTLPSGSPAGSFILDKQVHGDPHNASGILAHRIYGQQVFDDLRAIGYDPRFLELDRPAEGIFSGDLFLATRNG
jgi:SAM-dependent methyltransferase